MEPKIIWLGHASFRIEGSLTIYIDPWKLKGNPPKADLILITHEHHDHCSLSDVEKIADQDTVIVTEKDSTSKLHGNIDIKTLAPGQKVEVKGITIEAVPAYNLNKSFHPKSRNWIGFVFELDGMRIYHSGDTDCIPEMKEIHADVALLPVSGTYVMDAQEALKAIEFIKPQTVIPMHWGDIIGSKKDAETLKKQTTCQVDIQQPTI